MNQNHCSDGLTRRPSESKEQLWRETLRRFADSGQSVRAFCIAQGVSEPSFYFWKRRLARRQPTLPAPALVPVRIAQLCPQAEAGHVRASGLGSVHTEIVLANGHRLRLRGPVDQAALASVLSVLAGR
jgi:hypothetical protein